MDFLRFDTPLGPMALGEEEGAVTRLWLPGQPTPRLVSRETPLLRRGRQELLEYLAGERQSFDLPLCPRGTPFQRRVWSALGDIPYHLLGDYPEIVHGDLTPVLPAEQPAQAAGGRQGRIAVFDRGGQFDILRNVPGSYMWVSPVPFEILAQQELVQKPCRSASRYRDVLVRRRPGALSAAEVAFINELRREIAGLVQT